MSHAPSSGRALRLAACCALLAGGSALAGEADVVAVTVRLEANGTYDFAVAVRHADEGWNHYVDRWEILAPDRSVLATRRLRHPHVDEQPVTRDLAAVRIPPGVDQVVVRAHDTQHGYGGSEMVVDLSAATAGDTGSASPPAGRPAATPR